MPQYGPWIGSDSLKQFPSLPGFHSQLLHPKKKKKKKETVSDVFQTRGKNLVPFMKLVVQLHFNLRDFLGFNLVNY